MYFKLSFLKYTSQWYIQTISCISVFSFFKSYSAFDSIYPNLLTVEVSGIFVELNPSDNTRNIALDRFHFFWQYGEYYWSSSQFSFIMFMAKCFFLLIHFIVVEDYELSQSTIHLLSVPSALEYARILSWSIFFFFSTSVVFLMQFCVRLLPELMIYSLMIVTSWDSIWVVIWSLKSNFLISVFHQWVFDFKVSRFGT